jgi:xanthine dehydrogenase accessory factor
VTNLFAHMAYLQREGRAFALATVVRTRGSTPQVVGAKMVVAEGDDRPAGTLGGGCVEADAILAARDVLDGKGPSLRAYELTEDLAWNTGLVCGGTMWILAEPGEAALVSGGRSMLDDLEQATAGGRPVAMVTLLERDGQSVRFGGRVFVGTDGAVVGTLANEALDARASDSALRQLEHGTPRLVPLDDSRDLLVDPVAGKPRLVVAGGGHVALAIARQALLLDFDVTIIEDRPDFADPARFGGATVLDGDIPETLGSLDYGWTSFIVIATRGHKLDGACILAAVETDARYIGLLGSRRKTVLIAEMLEQAGVEDDRIKAIRAPVGLDLGGRTPAEIALSVLAEITQERYRATGRPLRMAASGPPR